MSGTVSILPPAESQFCDANGAPLVGGSVATYVPGTTTPATTWQDSAGATPNANPIILDAAGRAIIWGAGAYRTVVKDASGNQIWDQVTSTPPPWAGGLWIDSGGVNALAVTLTPVPSLSALTGIRLSIKVANTNTGAATLNINGLGPVAITNPDGTQVAANQLPASAIITVVYSGTSFQIQSSTGYHPGFSNVTVYGAAGTFTFTVPAGITRVKATVVGGGAGGGHGTASQAAAGGSAGGAAIGIYSVTPGQNITVVVGANGVGATVTGNSGTGGGTSSFGAFASATGATAGSPLNAGGAPGLGTGGTILIANGGAGADATGGTNVLGGCGGNSIFGGGGRMGTALGGPGGCPGAGGGGSYGGTPGNGGDGAPGTVILEY